MAARRKRSVLGTVLLIVTLVLLAGLIAVIYTRTNGLKDRVRLFDLVYNGERIDAGNSEMSFERGVPHTFLVDYLLDGVDAARGYDVRILANEEADFLFTVDGKYVTWHNLADITSSFLLEKEEDSFTLTIPEGFCVKKLLSALYAGQDVVAPDDEELPSPYIYSLTVSDREGGEVYRIDFSIAWTEGLDIQVPDRIFF